MAQVFISYSRQDADFVRHMVDALKAHERDTWVDWEDIPLTANWWQEICAGIEGAHTFLFVISPASLASPVCNLEIAHAVQNHKRLVPIVRVPVNEIEAFATLAARPPDEALKTTLAGRDILTLARDNWSALARHNWLFFSGNDQNEFDANFARLLDAIDTDLDHVHQHTRLLVRAREWDTHGRNRSYLLSGDDLHDAELWQAGSAEKDPQPTELQLAYLLASRGAANARSRALLTGVSVALTVSLGLAVLSFLLFGQSEERRTLADNNAQTATFALGQAEVRGTEVAAQATVAYENLLSSWDTQALFYAALARQQLNQGYVRPALQLAKEALAHFAEGVWHAENHLVLREAHNSPGLETAYMPHGDEVLGAVYSPDQTRILSWSLDGTVGIWDAETGESLFTLRHQAGVGGARWSADGSRVLTWAGDGVVTVWDATTGATLSVGRHAYNLVGAAWSPDESRVMSWANRTSGNAPAVDISERQYAVTITDAQTGETVQQARFEWFLYPSYWLSDERVLTYVRGRLVLWDANTGEVIHDLTVEPENLLFTSIGFSPDKSQVAVLDGGRNLRVWNLETGDVRTVARLDFEDASVDGLLGFGLADYDLYLEWMDDDHLLIPVGHYLMLYDLTTDTLLFTKDIASEIITANGFAPNLGGVRFNRAQNMILAWGSNFISLWGTGEAPSIGNIFSSFTTPADAGATTPTPTPSPKPPADLGYAVFAVETDTAISGAVWNADETRILTWSMNPGRVEIWNTSGQREFLLIPDSPDPRINGAIWTPDEMGVLTWGADGTVRRWQLQATNTEARQTMLGWLSIAVDQPYYIIQRSGCPDMCALAVVDARTGKVVRQQPLTDYTRDPSFQVSDTGLLLTSGDVSGLNCLQDCTSRLFVWNAHSGETLLDTQLEGKVITTRWQRDGTQFLVWYGTPFDCARPCPQTVEIWDSMAGERVTSFQSADVIQNIEWTNDGQAVHVITQNATTNYDSSDGSIIETETVTENLRDRLNADQLAAAYADYGGGNNLTSATLDPSGTRILLASYPAVIGNTGVLLTAWDAETGELLWSLRHGNTIYDAAYTRDGSRLLTWSEDGQARIIDPENGAVLSVLQHRRAGALGNLSRFSNPVWFAAWNQDDTRIMTASSDGTARVWDAATGQPLLILEHASAVRTAQWYDAERGIMTTDDSGTTYLWDGQTGSLRLSVPGITPILSEDRTHIFTSAADRTQGYLWDLRLDVLLDTVSTLEIRPFTNEERRVFFLPTFTPATPTDAPPDQRTPTPPTPTPLPTLTLLPTLTPSVTPTLTITPTLAPGESPPPPSSTPLF